jgi:hypothetical protein
MEIKLDVDATGRKRGSGQMASPSPFATVPPKVKVGAKSGQARIAALKVNK